VNRKHAVAGSIAILVITASISLSRIVAAQTQAQPTQNDSTFDVIIRNGHILDGSGNPWFAADIGIKDGRIAAIGKLNGARATKVIDATNRIVSPGFIDMLGQSEYPLLIDNRSISKLAQGITSEITGEGASIAPHNEKTLAPLRPFLDHYKLTVDWTTLDEYFKRLEKQGTPINIGTYVGAAQVREAVIGDDDRAPTPAELEQMKQLVAQAMKDGAFGISTALIYPPGHYAKTDELIELAKVAAQYGGIYGTHMRSEGASEMEAIDEAIRIGREAGIPVEIFHMKVSGKPRWGSMTKVVEKIQAARDQGRHSRQPIPLCCWGNRAGVRVATLGCRRRDRKVPRTSSRSQNPRTHQGRDGVRSSRLGKSLLRLWRRIRHHDRGSD
jgi:dihydroorotase/N-acyl-D-amino-acid deacylase